MKIPKGLARKSVEALDGFARTRIARTAPGSLLARYATNHLVPIIARGSFEPGEHEIDGVRIIIPETAGTGGEPFMVLGMYERGEIRYVSESLQPGDGMVDVGAHIGYFALHAASAVGPDGFVLAVEPTPASAEVLRRAVELNGFDDRIHVAEAAASSTSGRGSLGTSDKSPMFNTLELDTISVDAEVDVRLATIDELLDEAGWPRVDIIKMDVEGHEAEVIAGASATLERYPEVRVMFELSGTSDERYDVSSSTIDRFEAAGFSFYILSPKGELEAADVPSLHRRMKMPRWQDSLFNVVASRQPLATAT